MSKPRQKKPDEQFETLKTEYEGLPGPPWVAFYEAKLAEGWQVQELKVIKELSGGRFRGRATFTRPIQVQP